MLPFNKTKPLIFIAASFAFLAFAPSLHAENMISVTGEDGNTYSVAPGGVSHVAPRTGNTESTVFLKAKDNYGKALEIQSTQTRAALATSFNSASANQTIAVTVKDLSAAATVLSSEFDGGGVFVNADTSGGAFAVTLPTIATGGEGRLLILNVETGGNALTLTAGGSDTIDGQFPTLDATGDRCILISEDTNWALFTLPVESNTVALTASGTLTAAQIATGDALVTVNSTSGAVVVTFPESTGAIAQGTAVTVLIMAGTNGVTAAKTGSDTIQALTVTANAANDYFIYKLVGTRWIIVQEFAS